LNSSTHIKILDCTLRDGGYYCGWDYTKELISEYLNCISHSNIDALELGLRTPNTNKFLGPLAFTTDQFLNSLPLPRNMDIVVMINAKDFITNGKADQELLSKSFGHKSSSPVTMVRIAAHFEEVPFLGEMGKFLSDNGYSVAINLMQSGGKTREEIKWAVKNISQFQNFKILYFADSLGNMNQDDVKEIITWIKEEWDGEIGIHTHDNMGRAISNTLMAIEMGASWADATILGMGRGAGNAKIEYLLLELKRLGVKKFFPEAIFPLVLGSFLQLQEKYKWGPNLLYYLSADCKIHPTFIQELLGRNHQDPAVMINAIEKLKDSNSTSYTNNKLIRAMEIKHTDSVGDWNPRGFFKNKNILILGAGPSLIRHKEATEDFIKRKRPVVIALNTKHIIDPSLIDYYIACHPMRLLLESDKYKSLNRPLLTPFNSLPDFVKEKVRGIQVFNYGLKLSPGKFSIEENTCGIPTPLAIGYALAIVSQGGAEEGAKNIFLAGFDGYGSHDPRQMEMEEIFNLFQSLNLEIPLKAVTPTTYSIDETSIYSPGL
jgi:4-hydroxy 2-oxovalerate aldolase